MTRDSTAARVAELFGNDAYAELLGIELVNPDPSAVTLRLVVAKRHLNFFGVTHGGALFSLADCAFSLAANAPGDRAVAIDTHLALTAGTTQGTVLTAIASEITRGRTVATYRIEVRRIEVRRDDDRVCGLFTGTVLITPSVR